MHPCGTYAYDPNRLGNSFPSGGSLSLGAYILWVIGRKYFKIPCPYIANVTNPDKLKLVNYNRKYAIPKFSKCKILVGKILTIQHELVKFVRLFHRQSFTLYGIHKSICIVTAYNTKLF